MKPLICADRAARTQIIPPAQVGIAADGRCRRPLISKLRTPVMIKSSSQPPVQSPGGLPLLLTGKSRFAPCHHRNRWCIEEPWADGRHAARHGCRARLDSRQRRHPLILYVVLSSSRRGYPEGFSKDGWLPETLTWYGRVLPLRGASVSRQVGKPHHVWVRK